MTWACHREQLTTLLSSWDLANCVHDGSRESFLKTTKLRECLVSCHSCNDIPLAAKTLLNALSSDEIWVHLHPPETKRTSVEWKHPGFLGTKKFKVLKSVGKLMLPFFWDQKGRLCCWLIFWRREQLFFCSCVRCFSDKTLTQWLGYHILREWHRKTCLTVTQMPQSPWRLCGKN